MEKQREETKLKYIAFWKDIQMEKRGKLKKMVDGSILTASLIALFWLMWYLAVGTVPIVTSIKLPENQIIQFPFGISRLWDILAGSIISMILILVFASKTYGENKPWKRTSKIKNCADLACRLGVGIGFSLVIGVGFASGISWAFLLCVFLTVPLIIGVLTNIRIFAWQNPDKDLRSGLYIGLLIGLFFGFFLGLCHWEPKYSNGFLIFLFTLVYGISLGALYDLNVSIVISFLSCLTFGLSYGIIECGLLVGLGYTLILTSYICVILSIGAFLKYIFCILKGLK